MGTDKNGTVAVFSLEMSREQLVTRILSNQATVENQRLVTGNLREQDWVTVNEGKVHLRPLISKTFAFKDYLKAYQYIDDNRETTMKVIINVQEK